MNRSTIFWMIMILALLAMVGGWWLHPFSPFGLGGGIVLWIVIALIGWKVFGPIIRGD